MMKRVLHRDRLQDTRHDGGEALHERHLWKEGSGEKKNEGKRAGGPRTRVSRGGSETAYFLRKNKLMKVRSQLLFKSTTGGRSGKVLVS